ncbi:hypothetical protein EFA46_015180 (plasmid) [Halarchaeum sp. CBA1220]|uniref:hypothetical protein n=1 Tax=Halarchaeum sp. CBA1220 TaxID=1853682 RepID=UPI000F3A9349|nr:hypothetical protein [Halarchaeum sp. CBA1220]QLC35570.1 hypothetical protein EFA46_015180 [Halarchaeum sp. CBA1220]
MSRGLPVQSKYYTNPWFEIDESTNNKELVEALSVGDEVRLTVDAARYGDETERIGQQVVVECTTINPSYAVLGHLPDEIIDAVDEDRFDSLQCTVLAIDGQPIGDEGDGADADETAARPSTGEGSDGVSGASDEDDIHPRSIEEIHSRVESGHTPTDREMTTLRRAIGGTWETRTLAIECLLQVAAMSPSRARDLYPDAIEATLVTRESRVISRALLHELITYRAGGVSTQVIESDLQDILDPLIEMIEEIAEETPGEDDRVPTDGATAVEVAHRLTERQSPLSGAESRLMVDALAETVTNLVVTRARDVGRDPLEALNELRSRQSDEDPLTAQITAEGVVDGQPTDDKSAQSYTRSLYDGIAATRLALLVEREPADLLRAEAVITERIGE